MNFRLSYWSDFLDLGLNMKTGMYKKMTNRLVVGCLFLISFLKFCFRHRWKTSLLYRKNPETFIWLSFLPFINYYWYNVLNILGVFLVYNWRRFYNDKIFDENFHFCGYTVTNILCYKKGWNVRIYELRK